MKTQRYTKTHALEPGGSPTRTLCGRDTNPSCGSSGSHSAQPIISSSPTCSACRKLAAKLPAPAPRPAERKCSRWLEHLGRACGLDESLHIFIDHKFVPIDGGKT